MDEQEKTGRKAGFLPAVFSRVREFRYPLLIAVPVIVIQLFMLLQFQQLPSPVYGGDSYWHAGEALNIYDGAAPWENLQVSGEYAYYGWLNQLLVAWIARTFSASVESAYIFYPLLLTPLVAVVSYFLGREFFGDRKFAIVLSLISVTSGFTLIDPMRILGDLVLSMAFILFLTRAIRSGKISDRIAAGFLLGIAGLTHVIAFPALASFTFIVFLYRTFLDHISIKFNPDESRLLVVVEERKNSVIRGITVFLPVLVIGFIISLLFFGPIIFVYHGVVKNPLQDYTEPDLSKYGLEVLGETLGYSFLNISGPLLLVISLVSLLGLYAVTIGRRDLHKGMIFLLAASAIIMGFHYLVTVPLLGKALIPLYFYSFLMRAAIPLLFTSAVVFIYSRIAEKARGVLVLAVLLFLVINIFSTMSSAYNDTWAQNGRSAAFPVFAEITSWVDANTARDDVFLSHEELSFAVNSLTTRKVVVSRRTHFSPYLDIDQRIADAAVILYGNSSEKRQELIEKYGIKYIYWDANWVNFLQNEPQIVSPEYGNYLSQNGVDFQEGNGYLDPAFGKYHPKYDVLVIVPKISGDGMPWTEDFGVMLTLQKSFYYQGQEFARIYKIGN